MWETPSTWCGRRCGSAATTTIVAGSTDPTTIGPLVTPCLRAYRGRWQPEKSPHGRWGRLVLVDRVQLARLRVDRVERVRFPSIDEDEYEGCATL